MPSNETIMYLKQFGALPNVDYISTLRFHEKQEDYIVSGNVIGELGVLTNRPYDVTVSCDTSVQAYEIKMAVMQEAMKISYDVSLGLRARMWKAIAIRIANVILMNVPTYQSWSQEKIKYHLERAFVPTLTGFSVFSVNDLMEDILLIEGQAMDANSRCIFFAPTYIPRTVQKIFFPKCSMMNIETSIETKLLIIPAKDVDEYEIMETAEQVEMISIASSKCLQHTIQSRASATHSHPSRKMRGRGRKRNIYGFNTSRNKHDMNKKSSVISSFTSSKVFPTVESEASYTYPYSGEKFEPSQNQAQGKIPEWATSRSAPPIPKEKEELTVLPTDATINKNSTEVLMDTRTMPVLEKKESKEDVIDNNEEILRPYKKVVMADVAEEEEEGHDDENKN